MPRYIDADAIHYVEIGKGVEIALASDIDKIPTISPDDVRGVGCEVCNYDKPLPQEGLSHDFYIHDGAIYHYDSELGWEGTDIAFCPFCGKRLRMKGAEDGTTE